MFRSLLWILGSLVVFGGTRAVAQRVQLPGGVTNLLYEFDSPLGTFIGCQSQRRCVRFSRPDPLQDITCRLFCDGHTNYSVCVANCNAGHCLQYETVQLNGQCEELIEVGGRNQYLFDRSSFPQQSLTIHSLRFRAWASSSGWLRTMIAGSVRPDLPVVIPGVEIRLGAAGRLVANVTSVGPANHAGGIDPSPLYSGSVTTQELAILAAPVSSDPGQVYITIPIAPTVYDPTLGQDFILDIDVASQTEVGTWLTGAESANAVNAGDGSNRVPVVELLCGPASQPASVDFTADVRSVSRRAPTKTQFADRSSPGTSPILAWAWDLDGDGTTDATTRNPPQFDYAARGLCGTVNVTLTVTDALGVHTLTKPAFIEVTDCDTTDPGDLACPTGDRLWFSGNFPGLGRELWTATPFEAQRLAGDLDPGPGSSSPRDFTQSGGLVLFSASTSAHGRELWSVDELQVPRLVADANPGAPSSDPQHLTSWGGVLYYAATDAAGIELWRSNGTAAGTYRVKDLVPGPGSSSPHDFVGGADQLFFIAAGDLWCTDGTAAGTKLLQALPSEPTAMSWWYADGLLYFGTYDAAAQRALLWSSDGSSAGTSVRHTFDSSTRPFGVAGGPIEHMHAVRYNRNGGRKLWFTIGADFIPWNGYGIDFDPAFQVGVQLDWVVPARSQNTCAEFYVGFQGGLYTFEDTDSFGGTWDRVDNPNCSSVCTSQVAGPPVPSSVGICGPGPGNDALGRRVYFVADDGSNGDRELFFVDNKTCFRQQVKIDLNTYGSSSPTSLQLCSGRVCGVADTGFGREVFFVADVGGTAQRLGVANQPPGMSLELTTQDGPVLGQSMPVRAFGGPPGGLGYLLIGFVANAFYPRPVPGILDARSVDWTGLVAGRPHAVLAAAQAAPEFTYGIPWLPDLTLTGRRVMLQAYWLDLSGSVPTLSASNGLLLTLGY